MRKFVVAAAILATVLIASAPEVAAQAQFSGKAVDADGKPVKNLELRFVNQTDGASHDVTTRKNGGFRQGLPPGQYIVQATGDEWFVAKLSFTMTNTHGLTIGEGEMDGHPENGAGPFPFSGRNDVSLKLEVSGRGSAAAQSLSLKFAATELNESVKLYERGKYDKVVDATATILASDPDLGEAHYMMGIARQRLGQHDQAVESLEKAVAAIPDHPGIWNVLGQEVMAVADAAEEAGDAEAAKAAFARGADVLSEANEREPGKPEIMLELARALDRIGSEDRMMPLLEQMLEIDPNNRQARLRLASLYAETGDHEPALELLESLAGEEKRAAVTFYNVAVQLNDAGNLDGALTIASRATEIDPDLYQAHQLVAQIHLGQGNHPAAAKSIERFLALAPEDPQAETYRRILEQIGTP